MAITKIQPYIIDDTKDFTFNSVTATANLTANNANLGNLLTVNYIAGTLTTGAQPNITTVGTLGNLTVTSNIVVGNLKTDGILYANGAPYVFSTNAAGANTQVQFNDANSFGASANFTFDKSTNTLSVTNIVANGAGLTSLAGANVTGTVANATYAATTGSATTAGTVTTNAQPNITSVGTLSNLTVSGNVFAAAIVQNASTYDTRVSLGSSTGIVEISTAGNATKFNPSGQISLSGASQIVGGTFSGSGITLGASQTDIFQDRGGNVTVKVGAGGTIANTWTFAQDGSFTSPGNIKSLNANLGNAATANYFVGNLYGVANSATTAVTVTGNAQPNITSVGILSALDVTGNLTAGNIITGAGTGGSFTGANLVSASFLTGTLTTAAQPNITSVGTLGNLTVTSNVTAAFFIGNGSQLTGLSAGTANTSITVTGNAQPNITSVGTLTSLTVTGNITGGNLSTAGTISAADAIITGNLTVSGNTSYINVDTLRVEDPIIELGGGVNGAPLTTNDGKDRGSLLHYYNGAAIDSFMGWDTSNAEFAFGSNVSVANEVVTFNTLGNIRVQTLIGNVSATTVTATTGNLTDVNVTGTANISGNLIAGSISTGAGTGGNITGANLVSANYFIGNFWGTANTATTATTAGTVTTNAQPNITSVGTLSSLAVTGNVTAGNFVGIFANGNSNITIPAADGNIVFSTGGTPNELVITSTGVNVLGTLNATGNANVANIGATNGVFTNITGTLTTAAQPNITSVGNLTALTVTGNATVGALITGNITAGAGAGGNITGANLISANFITATSNVSAGNLLTDNLRYANGSPYIFSTSAAGANTQIQFNDANSFAGSANLTFNNTTNTLSVTNIVANGAGLTSITGANVTGTVANATFATTAGTVTTNAQPNITSVGTLTEVTVTGNATVGQLITGNITAGVGTGGNITGANLISANFITGTLTTAAQPNITSVGNLSTLSVTGNLTAGNIISNGGAGGSITGANLVSANFFTGTLTTAAQPNITSVGSLTDLSVSGNAVVTGNLTVNGNTNYINVETLRIEDPIIELGGGANGAPLTVNDGKDRGSLLHYYNGAAVDAFMGWDNSNGEFAFGSNVSVTGEVVTYNSLGNVRASNFIGNAIAGNVFTDNLKYANGSSYVFTTNAAGTNTQVQFNDGNSFAGSANFTFDKTTNTLTVTNFAGNGSQLTGITATSSNTANTANTANSALTAGTVTTNAQPNITSTGTLTSLTVSGVSNFGNVGNVIITGGVANAFLQTNGSGNLTWTELYNAVIVDNFVGDGANSSFTLSTAPSSINATMLNLGGVIQQRDSYAITGSTLTLDSPPALGALIEVTTTSVVNAGSGSFVTRTYSGNGVANTFAVTNGSTASSLLVMINGVVQVPTTDYTVSSGNVILVTPPTNVQTVQIREMAVAIPAGSSVAGSNSQVQFNDNGTLGATAGFTFNKSTNALSVGSVTASTFTGTLVGAATIATSATTAGTVTTAAQPNITSVGTLSSLTVTGNVTSGGITLGYMGVPLSGTAKTSSYTLATTDIGKIVTVSTGGSITIPNAVFSAGDAISLFNDTAGTITVTCTITTAYIGGTDADKATVTLATRGIATILFISGTVCVITGNVT